MARSVQPRPLVMLVVAVLIVINALVFGGRLTAWVADATGGTLAPISARMSQVRALVMTALERGGLAAENGALRDEVTRLQARIAQQESLEEQLLFYRAAAGIRDRTRNDPIAAGIFSYPQSGGSRQVIINRGRADWVALDDVVVTPTGSLVGIVSRVFEHHTVVSIVGDAQLDVTIRVSGSEVSGLLRTAPDGSVMMDLVQKNESVAEGAAVVTSGDDHYPAGLVVGTVRSVDNDAATLFKIVRIAPAVASNISGDVIVIKP